MHIDVLCYPVSISVTYRRHCVKFDKCSMSVSDSSLVAIDH